MASTFLGKFPAKFSANFDGEKFPQIFRPCFFQGLQAPPKKVTPKIVGIPLQFHFLEPKIVSHRFSAFGEDHELESGNAAGAFLQTPATVLDNLFGLAGARFLSSSVLKLDLVFLAYGSPTVSKKRRTIVKPLWQLPPSEAKKKPTFPEQKNVALKLPKISLAKGYLGNLRAIILQSWVIFLLSFASWGLWVTGVLQSF